MAVSDGADSVLVDRTVALPLVACTEVGTALVDDAIVAGRVTLEPPVREKVMPADDVVCASRAELVFSELTGMGLM